MHKKGGNDLENPNPKGVRDRVIVRELNKENGGLDEKKLGAPPKVDHENKTASTSSQTKNICSLKWRQLSLSKEKAGREKKGLTPHRQKKKKGSQDGKGRETRDIWWA